MVGFRVWRTQVLDFWKVRVEDPHAQVDTLQRWLFEENIKVDVIARKCQDGWCLIMFNCVLFSRHLNSKTWLTSPDWSNASEVTTPERRDTRVLPRDNRDNGRPTISHSGKITGASSTKGQHKSPSEPSLLVTPLGEACTVKNGTSFNVPGTGRTMTPYVSVSQSQHLSGS